MNHKRPLVGLALTALFAAACSSPAATTTPTSGPPATTAPTTAPTEDTSGNWPESIVIGFVPSRDAAALVETIQPIADYLAAQLGIEVEGFVSTDYTGLVTAMETGQAQVGAFNPLGIVQAVERAGGEFILQSERNGSGTYHTQFMTNNPTVYCTISDPVENQRESQINPGTFLNCNGTERGPTDTPEGPIGTDAIKSIPAGTTVSFVTETSASGYIFPATVLVTSGIPLDSINPIFAGAHDASAIAVCNGDAEVGVSFDDARSEATTECDLNTKVVVFAYGPEIPNDGIVVAGDLPASLKNAIHGALIAYAESEAGNEVLRAVYNITAFTEPNLDSPQIVRDAAANLGLE
jgi:phosphonate transport system substrate-binding protein